MTGKEIQVRDLKIKHSVTGQSSMNSFLFCASFTHPAAHDPHCGTVCTFDGVVSRGLLGDTQQKPTVKQDKTRG